MFLLRIAIATAWRNYGVSQTHHFLFIHRMSDTKHERFKKAFDSPTVRLLTMHNVVFVLVNSMALEGDGCSICNDAENKLSQIQWQLKCSKVC